MRNSFWSLSLLLPALLALFAAAASPRGDGSDEIRLIVRGDDMGSAHAANVACIRSYREGIMRSVELMVPCPWFPEAVQMLKENPGLDVGVHLVLTSEWERMKWRPLTWAPSLVDADGYFFPMVWQNPKFPPNTSLQKSAWKLEEVEQELRAQIDTALRHIPWVSHLSSHMGFGGLDPSLAALETRLANEYGLGLDYRAAGINRFRGWTQVKTAEDRIRQFVENLEALEPGTYVFVEHPGLNVPELQGFGHVGYEDVAADREAVTRVFTSPEVLAAVERKGIRLLGLKDLRVGR